MTTADLILAANRGRDPELLALKWAKMRENAFAFFRGTAPLFYRSWVKLSPGRSPLAWISGDAHIENMGSYNGANRVAYFDLNDFDDACLAPIAWEIGRALTGLHVLGKPALARSFLSAYRATLEGGKPSHIELEVAEGPIRELLWKVHKRTRKEFVKQLTTHGKLNMRPGHTFRLRPAARKEARLRFERWARRQPDPGLYRVLDLCGRIAGTGSLGLERFIFLVKGRRRPFILEMKEAATAAPQAVLRVRQPSWACEAERVATVQHFMQYVPVARLSWTGASAASYIVRELQPFYDRVIAAELSPADYDDLIRQWARLVASAHLRTAGWKGSVDLDGLIAYGRALDLGAQRRLVAAAQEAAAIQRREYAAYFRNFASGSRQ
jgi:uncharacterized protein (DUF2252 family)